MELLGIVGEETRTFAVILEEVFGGDFEGLLDTFTNRDTSSLSDLVEG